jgi:DNA-binding IclR family transcriptional regulator
MPVQDDVSNDPLFIRSVARAMEVLRCVGQSQKPINVSEIAAQSGLTQSNAWRISYTLRSLGYLKITDGGDIQPGLPLLSLGYAALATDSIHKIAKPYLTELAEKFRAAAGIAVRNGLSMIYLERSEGHAVLNVRLRPGSAVTLMSSAMGWAYLSGTSKEERDHLLAQIKRDEPQRWKSHARLFKAAHAEAAGQGFILCVDVFHPGVGMAAATVRHPRTGTLYSINCGGLTAAIPLGTLRREVGPAVRRAAEQIQPLLASIDEGPAGLGRGQPA